MYVCVYVCVRVCVCVFVHKNSNEDTNKIRGSFVGTFAGYRVPARMVKQSATFVIDETRMVACHEGLDILLSGFRW